MSDGSDVFMTGIGNYTPRLMHTNETLPPLEKPVSEEELAKIGVTRRDWAGEGVFRVSVGLEEPQDLIGDLEQALG